MTMLRASADGEAPLSTNRARLRALLGERRGTVIALGFCAVISGLAEAGILALLAEIAGTAAKGGSHVHQNLGPFHIHAGITTLFVIAVTLTIVRVVLQAPLAILPARIAADVQAGLRSELFAAFTHASWEVQSRDREGHLQETMTSQVLQATGGAMQATQLVIAGFSFVVIMASAVSLNAVAAIVIFVGAVLLFGALRPLNDLGARRARELSVAQLAYAGGVSEASRLAEETQVFDAGEAQRKQTAVLIGTARELFYRTQLIGRLSPSLYQSAIYLILVGGLAALYSEGASHFTALGAVILLIVRAGTYGQQVQGAYQGLRQSLPFIERLQDSAHRYEASAPAHGSLELAQVDELAFEQVSFGYEPDRPVLSGISFEVKAGEAIGVVGPSGAGKSTLIQLLLQLRRPDAGRYLVNGTPVEQFARDGWHRHVAYVPQQPRLVHATVAENIRFSRDLDDEAVERAARLARIHDEVMSWPQGYDTVVGPRADAVSGGQQQRICVARALAGRPAVLVLDEPTSALDAHSETLIQESLRGLRRELTLFIIAHRLTTLDICDRLMVIDGGELIAFDDTEQLKRNNSYYRSASLLASGAEPEELGEPRDAGDRGDPEPRRPAPPRSVPDTLPALSALAASPEMLAVVSGGEGAGEHGRHPAEVTQAGAVGVLERPPSVAGRVPDFFIVGHAKSGTTALYEMLRPHPQIFMPRDKEPWFFSTDMRARFEPVIGGLEPESLDEYLKLFAVAEPGQRAGEASSSYLWSRTAAQEIAAVQPNARIIAILREPTSFLRSLHLQLLQTHVESERDLRRAIALEGERREGRNVPARSHRPQLLQYSDHIRYVEQLQRYREVFGAERMLVLIYEDFRRDNEATVREVLRFLEVDDGHPIEVLQANPTVGMRSQQLDDAVHAVSVGRSPLTRAMKGVVKTLMPRALRRSLLQLTVRRVVYGTPPAADEALMRELRQRFRGEVVALSEYLDRDLVTLWGYDDAG